METRRLPLPTATRAVMGCLVAAALLVMLPGCMSGGRRGPVSARMRVADETGGAPPVKRFRFFNKTGKDTKKLLKISGDPASGDVHVRVSHSKTDMASGLDPIGWHQQKIPGSGAGSEETIPATAGNASEDTLRMRVEFTIVHGNAKTAPIQLDLACPDTAAGSYIHEAWGVTYWDSSTAKYIFKLTCSYYDKTKDEWGFASGQVAAAPQ